MRKWISYKSGLLILLTLILVSGDLTYAVTEIVREVRATITTTLKVPDGIEVYTDETLTQPVDLLEFGEVTVDLFGTVGPGAQQRVWVKNLSDSNVFFGIEDDFGIGTASFKLIERVAPASLPLAEPTPPPPPPPPPPLLAILLLPDEVIVGDVGMAFHQQPAEGSYEFTINFVAEGPVIPVPGPTPTNTPEPVSQGGRLKFATPAPWVELTVPWDGDTWGSNLSVRNHMEPLIERHYKTGEMLPLLANSWSMDTPDATQWTFNLKQGAPFSYGWGDFSAQDVAHVIRRVTPDGAIPSDNARFRTYLGQDLAERESRVVQVDDFTVTFNLKIPEPDFNGVMSADHSVMLMHSKRQWDEAGEAVSRAQAAGTGPWKFIKHNPGFNLLWEAKENHHKKSPEFKEFEMVLSPEPATRMAMLLTGEAHIAELPAELHAQLVAKGMQVKSSQQVATQVFYLMAGNYLPTKPEYQPDGVFASVKVREAVNRAINREQVMNQIFKGIGTPQRVFTAHPDLYGWDNRYETEWEEKYGYDPEKAKQLIKDAGFEGANVEVMSFVLAGLSEAEQMAEVLQQELNAIGLNATITTGSWARLFQRLRERKGHGMVWPQKTSFTTPVQVTRWYNTDTGCCSTYVDPFIEETHMNVLLATSTQERDNLMRQIIGYKFDNYAEAPLLWVPTHVVVDPEIVADYTWPGIIDSGFSHFEYVRPAQ